VIDLHSHILPGLDDGPAGLDGAVALATAAVAAGTEVLVATPHIGLRYPIAPRDVAGHVARLRSELAARSIELSVLAGGELAPARALDYEISELGEITLGDSSCLLLECPYTPSGDLVVNLAGHLQRLGFRILLAHPERSPDMQRRPERLAALVADGAFVQLTAGSLTGRFGRTVRRFSIELLQHGLAHVVASDAHDAVRRPPDLLRPVDDALRRARLPAGLGEWLTRAVPGALLADGVVPDPPAAARGRRRRRAA
jgi:protein-tyrosine phosphatase